MKMMVITIQTVFSSRWSKRVKNLIYLVSHSAKKQVLKKDLQKTLVDFSNLKIASAIIKYNDPWRSPIAKTLSKNCILEPYEATLWHFWPTKC